MKDKYILCLRWWVVRLVLPSQPCERDISGTPWGNSMTFGAESVPNVMRFPKWTSVSLGLKDELIRSRWSKGQGQTAQTHPLNSFKVFIAYYIIGVWTGEEVVTTATLRQRHFLNVLWNPSLSVTPLLWLQKTFNWMECDSLVYTLERFGFGPKCISYIATLYPSSVDAEQWLIHLV